MRKIISWKGCEILHRHVGNLVYFSGWDGNNRVNSRQIRKDNRDIDWDSPLANEDKDFLVEEDK